MANQITIGEVVNEAGALMGTHFRLIAGMAGGLAALYSAADLLLGANSSTIPSLIALIFAQYYLTEQLLADRLPLGAGMRRRRYGAVFVSSLLAGLGILFGLLFFIVPGIILISRWALTTPYIVVEECGGVRAMEMSWEGTAPSRMTMFLLYLVFMVAFIMLVGGGIGSALFVGIDTVAGGITANIASSVSSVSGWLLAVAAYRRIETSNTTLDDIFA